MNTDTGLPPFPVVLLGTSGHAREVAAIASLDRRLSLLGCIGPSGEQQIGRLPADWLGEDSWLDRASSDIGYLIGIGAGTVRRRLSASANIVERSAPILVHPSATVGPAIEINPGVIIWPGAVLTTDITVGVHAHISVNVSVGHDARLGNFSTLLPGCTIGGFTQVGDEATIGAGASVIEGIRVGQGATVGAGAVVVDDVPDGATVVGIPAKPIKKK